MKIAGNFTVADWDALKEKLNIGETDNWKLAYKVFFLTRLETRYFEPIRLLQKHGENAGEGFSIVALQCSLIEFLASTLNGKNYKHCPTEADRAKCGEYEYCQSSKLFTDFLHTEVPFKDHFTSKTKAGDFFENVRCALLHEARTKGGWKIRAESSSDCLIDMKEKKEKIVYRDNLQLAFEEFVRWYGENLPSCDKLQSAFIRKFDSLCKE